MSLRSRQLQLALILITAAGCASNHSKGPDDDGVGDDGGTAAGAPPDGPACLAHELTAEIAAVSVDSVDIVFVVDDSASMRDEQAALSAQFPDLIAMLTTGDIDGDGVADVVPAQSLHLAVVSTDLGLPGVAGFEGCEGLGDNGLFRNTASPDIAGCSAQTYEPPFLTFDQGAGDDPAQLATDLECVATLGIDECTIEQPLESLLKSVWPASDSSVVFVTDSNGGSGFGQAGPGAPNGDFIRGVGGSSVIALVVVTDDEDCSVRQPERFAPGASPNGLGTRCFFEGLRGAESGLFQIERYIEVLKLLRPGQENLVIFGGIVGVPQRLVAPEALAPFDLLDPGQAQAFFDTVLSAPELQEVIDDKGTPDVLSDDGVRPSCDRGVDAKAFPPRRIVQVARGFGANGFIESICQDDFSAPIRRLVETIGRQLGAVCLPRSIPRDAGGLIECDVTWELPPTPIDGAPTSCSERPFLEDLMQIGSRGGRVCKVTQLSVDSRAAEPEPRPAGDVEDGWYYDDFSSFTEQSCLGSSAKQRIAFTDRAQPAPAVTVKLSCFQAEYFAGDLDDVGALDDGDPAPAPQPPCSAGASSTSPAKVGDPCFTLSVPEAGFEDTSAYVEGNSPYCDGGACLVYHLAGDPRAECGSGGSIGDDPVRCASPQEVENRVYCSCRCNAPEGFNECQCPRDFSCVDVLDNAPHEIAGGYCVRNGTVSQ